MRHRLTWRHVTLWISVLDALFWVYVGYVMVYQMQHPQFDHHQGQLLFWLVVGLTIVIALNSWLVIHFRMQLHLDDQVALEWLLAIFVMTAMLMSTTWLLWGGLMIGLPLWINMLICEQRTQQKKIRKR